MSNPDELLTDAREARRRIEELSDRPFTEASAMSMSVVAAELSARFSALDDHMSAGGYPPTDWPQVRRLPSRDDLADAIRCAPVPALCRDEVRRLADHIFEHLSAVAQ